LKNNNKDSKLIFSRKEDKSILTNELKFNTNEPSEIPNKKNNLKSHDAKNKANERIKSTDYRKWDLYNVEEEVKKIDNDDKIKEIQEDNEDNHAKERIKKIEDYSRRLNKEKHIPSVSEEIKQKSQEELKVLAEIEKNKGNDCFKSKDYEEAVILIF